MKTAQPIPVFDEALAAQVEALARKIWPEHYTPIIGEAQVAYMLEKFQTQKALLEQINEGYFYYLIQNNEKTAIGYLAVQPREAELFLSKLYLLKETRGKGLSRFLLEWLKSFAQNRGLSKITLTVHKLNPSVEIYQKLGFQITGPVVTDIGNGFMMDDYQMEWVL
jgi:GNAT superfamily N-acetyltransferase